MARRRSGKFITFEGLDGSGKSTQLGKLARALRAQGVEVVVTREPGGTPVGEKVRQMLLDSRTCGLSPWAEMALMFASRAQQVEQVILPALREGKFVLCDRFTDSTEAYQGGGRQLGSAAVLALHKILCQGLQPDLTVWMMSEVDASVLRARRRNQRRSPEGNENRFEQEDAAFFERVVKAYQAIARREPQRVLRVDARRSIPVVHREILEAVRSRFLAAGP